jgi:hypothetical protein
MIKAKVLSYDLPTRYLDIEIYKDRNLVYENEYWFVLNLSLAQIKALLIEDLGVFWKDTVTTQGI